ncbi:hypothetical protein APW76_03000 [Staphylococcus aureus]|nr:exodeoxyribonuclease VII large subunit [Staphylococcus aureus]PAI77029.1 hypothetical protein APW76_03000 [Staphylococcus aureus]
MLKENERFDQLIKEDFSIIQNDDVFSFSTDALLLGHFTKPRTKDIVLDLCSGNGVIPLLLFAKHPRHIEGVEIQKTLVDMARRTFQFNDVDEYLTMHHMDLKNVTKVFKPSQYTLVTCNPPYFKENQQHQHQKEAHKIASTGAAIRDIHSTINSRFPLAEQIQISTLVQGEKAKDDIIEKIEYADSLGVDTIIVGRGGGSIEDLWNFNEEAVVRAIYNCKTPIISAVGHETDFTLSDFAADIRAATPTQAAVIATPDQYELLQQIQQYQFTLTRFIKKHLEQQRKHVEHLSSYYKFKQPTLLYDQQIQRRDDLEKRLKQQIQATFEQQRHRLMLLQQRYNLKALLSSVNQEQQNNLQLTNQLVKLLNSKILSYKNDLKNKVENLNNLSPTNTMLRGYAIVNKKDEVITSTKDLTENDQLTLTMKDGLVDAKVTKVRCNND